MESKRHIVPTALIVNDGRVLLARRPQNKSFGGQWETPGGKAGPDETAVEALRRELRKELGVEVEIGHELLVVDLDPPLTSCFYRIPIYAVTLAGEPKPLAADELRWVTLTEARALPLTPATQGALAWAATTFYTGRPAMCAHRPEAVDHPAHYGGTDNPYEAIKVIEAWGLGFCLGNTVKYIVRAGKKDATVQDLKKSRWYLDREIQRLEALEAERKKR